MQNVRNIGTTSISLNSKLKDMQNTVTTFRNFDGTKNAPRFAAKISNPSFKCKRSIDHYDAGTDADGVERIFVTGFAHKFYSSEKSAINAANKVIAKYTA